MKNESLNPKELDTLRAELATLKAEHKDVSRMPRTIPETELSFAGMVDSKAALFENEILIPRSFRHGSKLDRNLIYDEDRLLGMLCWMCGDQLKKRLGEALAAEEQVPGISDADRSRRLAELDQEILTLEQEEERLLRRLEGAGFNAIRRPDARPEIILSEAP